MYFNRKNTEQKNWRMIKKGKHFLFGCSLVLAIGGTFVAPSVKADTVEPQPESSTTNEEEKPTSKEESSTYVAPAVTVASTTVTETNTAPATDEKTKEASEATVEKTKESDAIQAPSLTMVADPAALTEEEKANVVEAVKGVNPTATDVQVQADGSVVVTFADGSSATLTPSQTIKAGSQVVKPRRTRAVAETTSATRATEGSQNLDYSNRDNPEGYIKMNYEVDDAQNTIHWSVVVNGGRIGNQTSGYSYFTVPKDSVGAPTNWRVLQTDKYGNTMSDRRYWKNNDGIYTMGGAGRMNLYTGSEMTKELTRLYEKIGNPAIKGNEAAAAQQASERSQALYRLTADVAGGIAKNPSWTITFDTPIVDKSKTLDYTAGLQGTGAGKKTNIMTGYADNFIDNSSSKFQAVAVKEKYTAKVGGSFDATPANYVTNKPGTPEFPNNYRGATTFAWKDGQAPTATTPGTYTKTVVVTYPAHYNQAPQEVTVTFEVEGETPKPVAPAGQAPEITSNLDGKASTPADVTVNATAGSTVKLYNKDGVVIGEAVANDQGVATISPTNSLPEGEITATSTPAGGTESAKSAPITVTKTPTPYTDPGETNAPYYKLGVGTNTTQVSVYRGDNLLLLGGGASSSLRWFGVTPETIGNVKGVKYTEFLRTRTNAQGKLEGPVAWDQPLGETKVVFGATGSENATSRKLLSVYRPITVTVLETTKKYDPVAGTKVDVADSNNLSVDDKNKVIAAVKAANANSDLPLPADSQYSVDEKGNLTITYPDGSTDKIAAAYLVNPTKDTTAPDKPVVNTDLTGKAGTKTPVEVTAEKGSTVALYDKDNNKIGEATAGENGKATITPTVDIPAGAVTAKATDAAGNTSVASDPATATPAADTEAPAKPVVNTDLTGKAGTKTPVEVTAEKGSTVALYDKDNNKIGEATAGENGKATITPTVDIPAGAVTAKATDAAGNTSVASDPATATATVVAPTVEIPYSNKDTKEVYVYAGEENSFDIKFKDDSGKIVSATVKQGGNREFSPVAGEANTINTQYGFKANVISSETPATAESPAVITYRGTPAATDGLKPEVLEAATKGENPAGMVLGWRYATATDTDGAFIENKAVGSSTATDPGAFRVVLKAQSQKYDIATPTEKVTVADPANVTEAELGKIKEKLKLEYSQTNDDANLADKKGTTADKTNKIQSVAKDADGNLVVTYTDGSQDKKPLSEFVTKAPTVELPYSNQEHKQIYVYTGENTDLTFKAADDTAVKDMYVRGPGGIGEDNTARYGFTTGKIENSAVTHGDGTVSGATATIKMTGVTTLKAPNRWTSFVVANDNDNAPSNTDFNALDKNPNATKTPGYVQFIVKSQTDKYDIATPAPADKVEVADPTNVTNDDLDKIKEKLQLEYNKKNDDANISKDSPVDKNGKIKSVTKDDQGNLVVTYTDGSTDTKPLTEFVTKKPTTPDTEAPAKPVVDTDLTGKAGTKTPVEVSAEPGTNVELFDKDGNKIGEATADENGKATITPTVDIPAGAVTAKATDPAGNVSEASDPATASADTEAPAKPVVNTDLTGKAGTKTPVEVSAEPGTKVELFDKDGNKIGEATADENGKATITPTVDIPAGAVTAKATDPAGNVSEASDPATASADTEAPAKPVVNTDLTGKAGTKTPVEVSAEPGTKVELFDKDGNKIGEATADENGKATITPTVDIPAGAVTAKATDPAGNVSEASDPATASADTEAPAKPVVNTDLTGKAGTKTPVEVSAEPGTKVELFDKDGNKIGEATADENGKATITPTVDIPAGAVTAKATDPAGNVSEASDPATASADTEAPAKPVVNTDLTGKAGTKTPVEVSAEPGTKVELFDKDGNKIGEATADENGKATITPTVDIPAGAVTAKATDPAGNVSEASDPATASADTEAPAKPVVNTDLTGKAGTKTPVEVSAEPGTKVELFDKDGNKIGEATADENGKATITPTVDIPAGAVTAKATDPAGNVSEASDPATASADTEAPAKPVVNTDLTGKAGTKTPVEVSAEPGTKVELFDKDGNKIGEATADENGKATITPTVDIPAGAVTAKATDPAGNTSVASDPATASADTEAPAKPVVNTDLTGKAGTKTPVEVSAEPGTKVELFDKDGNKIGEATADENGKATITPTVDIPAGAVTAKATDPAGNTSVASDPATASADTEAPAKPVVNTDLTGKAGTKTPVEVSAEPGTKVELFDKDGNKIGEATADENGKATITPTVDIPAGAVTAKATDPAGNTSVASDPATASADTEAPAKPVVNTDLTGKAGTKTPVEVSAEPGTKVELFDKDGNKIGEATADENGKATITPTVDIPAGAVTAKATDPAGNVSEASDPATASADTEAPAKPVVDTDLTGKAGTKTPVVVSAEPGSKVELFDKDGNKIGEATADENGKATITPTVDIPAGAVTAKATDPAGNTSVASDPATASADTEAPAKPVVNTDLTGKAGTKTPVEVSAEPGTKVELFDKDGNKIGEATADENGKATITPTVDIPAGAVTAKATDPAGNVSEASDPAKATSDDKSVKDPAVTPVVDPSNLTDAEKAKVADEVKKANPTASKVEVGNDGTATVTYPDGTTAVIPADKTVKKSDDKSVKDPAVTPVVDPNNLTDAEKAKVADEVKKANPTASKVEVGNDGTATVTYPDGTTAVIPADKTVKKSDDKSVKDPAVTPVVDPSNLTDAEKAKVADEVKKANPTASKVEVGNDGTATVTYPDGTTAVIPADKTVKKSDDKSVKDPAVTPVVDPNNLTDAEKAKVADEVKKANPTASKVEVGNDGTATVTYPDGTTAILTPKQTITKVSETGNKGNSNSNSDNNSDKTSNTFVKVPAEKTLVKDPSNLTDAERSEIVSKIKQVNPGATVKVDRYGNATVELNGKNVVISSEQLIVSAKETNGQASHQGRVATDSSKKSESGKLPSTGEEQSVASIGLAILSALTGGLLLSKKRKEEE